METTKKLQSEDLGKITALLAKIGDTDYNRALRILSLHNFLENDDVSLLTDDKLKSILGSYPKENTPEYKKLILDKLKVDLQEKSNVVEDAAKVLKAKICQELFTNDKGKKFKDYLGNKYFAASVKYVVGSDSLNFPAQPDDAPEKTLARKFINDLGVDTLNQENSSILSKLITNSIEENKGKVKNLVRTVDKERSDELANNTTLLNKIKEVVQEEYNKIHPANQGLYNQADMVKEELKKAQEKTKLKNNLEKIGDALILGKSQLVLDVMIDDKSRDPSKKGLPKTGNIKISNVTSLQRTTDIEKAFKKIKASDDLFNPLESFDSKGGGKAKMVGIIKDCIADYGASVWYKRAARVENNEESKWKTAFKITGRVLAGITTAGISEGIIAFTGDKKYNQTIDDMLKEVNQKFIKKMDETSSKNGKPNHNFMIGTTLAAMDESKTEYDYKNSTVTFFVKNGEEANKLGLKEGHTIEVKFTDLTGKYSKDYKNIFQNPLKKYGSEYNKFKNERISLAKEMLQGYQNHISNIKLYDGENKLIDTIEQDLVKNIEENKFNKLGSNINYNHDAGRKVTIKINDNNNKLGLKKGDEIVVETLFHPFGASIKERYREAIDILKNPTSSSKIYGNNEDRIFIKRAGAKNLETINDFLKIDKNLGKEQKKEELKKIIMPKEIPITDQLKNDFSLYQKKEDGTVEKIQDKVKQVTLGALYQTSNILNQEVKSK